MEFKKSSLENMVGNSALNSKFWRGKKIFITGHTGFKGSWLSIWLNSLGCIVKGYSLEPPTAPSLYVSAKVQNILESHIGDIRDFEILNKSMISFNPDIVIHMAAQPLVRYSYTNPKETFQTNVIGTVNVLDSVRDCENVKVVLCITTDKVYKSKEWPWPYRETDELGGNDPYSCSKSCTELIAECYDKSYFKIKDVRLVTARAGNVIGGGDWAQDRLVPDILQSIKASKNIYLRYPQAIRPWQHVLEPLLGYLLLIEEVWGQELENKAWNFGPNDESNKSVLYLTKRMLELEENDKIKIIASEKHGDKMKETNILRLDNSQSKKKLNWRPKWNLDKTLEKIIEWNKAYNRNEDMYEKSLEQIKEFLK